MIAWWKQRAGQRPATASGPCAVAAPPSFSGKTIEITEVRVIPWNDRNLRGFANIVLGGVFAIRSLKIVQGRSGPFVAMPSRTLPDGRHLEVVYPINQETRRYMTEVIMAEYERQLANPTNTSGR